MSRFFRSADSSSTNDSESESDDEPGEDVRTRVKESSPPVFEQHPVVGSTAVNRLPAGAQATHRDFLLHALLEQRCTDEVLASYNTGVASRQPRRDSPEVQSQARARYQRLCAQLASLDLISVGLDADQHATTRQRYRDGLDILSQQRSAAAVPPSLRRLLTDSDVLSASNAQAGASRGPELFQRQALSFPFRRLLTGGDIQDEGLHEPPLAPPFASHFGMASLPMTRLPEPRYLHEFEELSMLGRGGYGIVYHVRHRLDNQFYAIKKVPLSEARLRRIQHRGQSELDEVLRELRILARLDHPNIVRYFAGWIEWVEGIHSNGGVFRGRDASNRLHSDAVSGATENSDEQGSRAVFSESKDDQSDVFFEDSRAGMERVTERSISNIDNTVESISRVTDTSNSIQSVGDSADFRAPTLALHMQMSLHPMTLAEFISPAPAPTSHADAPIPLAHCFHLEPSVAIAESVLDGIEYLHSEGIVHRDIKPGNIFLGQKNSPVSSRGAVELMSCSRCRATGQAAPMSLEVRIGDFGLVSVADPEAPRVSSDEVVGTEIYRRAGEDRSSPAVDIYALGIIMFELLCKFNTRMERVDAIQQLKRGVFPPGFADHLGKKQNLAERAIKSMLCNHGQHDTIPLIRQMLRGI